MKPKIIVLLLVAICLSANLFADEKNKAENSVFDITAHVLTTGAYTFSTCVIVTRFAPDMKLFPKYLISGSVGMIPGLIKEFHDKNEEDNFFSERDLVWNAVGAGSGLLLHYFLFDINRNKHAAGINYHPREGIQLAYTLRF